MPKKRKKFAPKTPVEDVDDAITGVTASIAKALDARFGPPVEGAMQQLVDSITPDEDPPQSVSQQGDDEEDVSSP